MHNNQLHFEIFVEVFTVGGESYSQVFSSKTPDGFNFMMRNTLEWEQIASRMQEGTPPRLLTLSRAVPTKGCRRVRRLLWGLLFGCYCGCTSIGAKPSVAHYRGLHSCAQAQRGLPYVLAVHSSHHVTYHLSPSTTDSQAGRHQRACRQNRACDVVVSHLCVVT